MVRVGDAVGTGVEKKFETIPKSMWGYPEWIDQERAKQSMKKMERKRVMYAGVESYHHMCRFQSGSVTNQFDLQLLFPCDSHTDKCDCVVSSSTIPPSFPTNTIGA